MPLEEEEEIAVLEVEEVESGSEEVQAAIKVESRGEEVALVVDRGDKINVETQIPKSLRAQQ